MYLFSVLFISALLSLSHVTRAMIPSIFPNEYFTAQLIDESNPGATTCFPAHLLGDIVIAQKDCYMQLANPKLKCQ